MYVQYSRIMYKFQVRKLAFAKNYYYYYYFYYYYFRIVGYVTTHLDSSLCIYTAVCVYVCDMISSKIEIEKKLE